jgi:hypothetical protein
MTSVAIQEEEEQQQQQNGDKNQNTEELAAAISDALNDGSSSAEFGGPGGSYSANSSFMSIDVTQELNDLLQSAGTEGDDDNYDAFDIDAGDDDDDDDDDDDNDKDEDESESVLFEDIETKDEDESENALFEDIETKDENDEISPISVMDNAAASIDEKLSSSARPQKKELGDSLSSDSAAAAVSTTVIDDVEKKYVDDDAAKNKKEEKKINKNKNNNNNNNDEQQQQQQKHIDVVPLKQFENALALIQDLENRIQVLETDRQCLVEENDTLREETLKQAGMMAQMEDKLALFPKLLEETVTQEAQVAAAQAEAKTKISFWKKDMQRQEKELKEEKLKQNRKGSYGATTQSLKQSDFLKDVVERKEQEEFESSLTSFNNNNESPLSSPVTTKNKIGNGFFSNFRAGWGNRNNNNNNNNNNKADNDGGDVNDNSTNIDLSIEKSKKSSGKIDNGDSIDTSFEMNNGVEDDRHDDKVAFDLMT